MELQKASWNRRRRNPARARHVWNRVSWTVARSIRCGACTTFIRSVLQLVRQSSERRAQTPNSKKGVLQRRHTNPDMFASLMKGSHIDKPGRRRTETQTQAAVTFTHETVQESHVQRKQGVNMLPRRRFIQHFRNEWDWKKERAKKHWSECKKNPNNCSDELENVLHLAAKCDIEINCILRRRSSATKSHPKPSVRPCIWHDGT